MRKDEVVDDFQVGNRYLYTWTNHCGIIQGRTERGLYIFFDEILKTNLYVPYYMLQHCDEN